MKVLKSSLAVLFLLSMVAVAPVSADDRKTIFYNVTTEDAWAAGMALGQANKAIDAGYKVVIFLNVHGIFIASKSFLTDINGLSGKSMQDMLKAAMDKGARVIICPMCMKKAGLTMDDLIEGVVKGGPDVTLKAMTAEDTVVISF